MNKPNEEAVRRGLRVGALLRVRGFDADGDPLCEVVEVHVKVKAVKSEEQLPRVRRPR